MPLQLVDVGANPDDGNGDTVRAAFEKINSNFDALVAAIVPRLLQHPGFSPLRHEHDNAVPRFLSDTGPQEPPIMFGSMWIDTQGGKIYLATGTAAVEDWREIAFVN